MKLLVLLSLLFTTMTFAQDYEYQLKGKYLTKASPKPVAFTLRWAEDDGKIKGEYQDSFFADGAPVKGTAGKRGRSFTVTLNEDKQGIRTLHFLSARVLKDKTATTIPVSVITRDGRGNPLSSVNTDAQFMGLSLIAQKQEADEAGNCGKNFGVLGGFCGIYNGLIAEEEDETRSCDLLEPGAALMELNEAGSLFLHLGENPSLVVRPHHYLGRIPADPESRRIDIVTKNCRPLPQVDFAGVTDECKLLQLTGVFTEENEDRHFQGTYTIRHMDTGRTCRYGLSLDD